MKNPALLSTLGDNLQLITQVLNLTIKSSDSWQNKKVKKTALVINIFLKLAKALNQSKQKEKYMS